MALTPKPGSVTNHNLTAGNVTHISYSPAYVGPFRTGSLPDNDWPVVEILSYGLSERKVLRRNGDSEYIKYNRDYFTVEKKAAPDELYRLSVSGFTFELYSGLTAIQSSIEYGKGSRPGLDVIVSCLLENGAPSIVNHEPTKLLAELWLEFNQRQRFMDSFDLSTISDILRANPRRESEDQPEKKASKSYKRVPSKIWEDTGISLLAPRIGIQSYWLSALAIMVSMVKQPSVNPIHTSKMNATLKYHFDMIESKSRMVRACLDVARNTGGWGPSD